MHDKLSSCNGVWRCVQNEVKLFVCPCNAMAPSKEAVTIDGKRRGRRWYAKGRDEAFRAAANTKLSLTHTRTRTLTNERNGRVNAGREVEELREVGAQVPVGCCRWAGRRGYSSRPETAEWTSKSSRLTYMQCIYTVVYSSRISNKLIDDPGQRAARLCK